MEEQYCKKYKDDQSLPDEEGKCSLCGSNCVDVEIEIEKSRISDRFSVHFSISVDIQLSGDLIPFETGRCTAYQFEPSWFLSKESGEYYDEHNEEIQDMILNQFNKM